MQEPERYGPQKTVSKHLKRLTAVKLAPGFSNSASQITVSEKNYMHYHLKRDKTEEKFQGSLKEHISKPRKSLPLV